MTTLVVDGYNAINAIPEVRCRLKEGLLAARSEMMKVAREYVRSSGYIDDFYVVFDGQDKYRGHDKSIYARKEEVFSATGDGDDTIIATVRKYSFRGNVIVATNDNYVKNMSRGYGASLITSNELYRRKKNHPGKRRGPSKKIAGSIRSRITREYKRYLGID